MNHWRQNVKKENKRANSDEYYVIDLCDKILGYEAKRQHRFDFLRGDPGKRGGLGTKLPVDAYYEELNLVIEYWERQHTVSIPHFNKPQTCSGVSRDEQRAIYDERRKKILPKNGIKLVIIQLADFHETKKINRKNLQENLNVIKSILSKKHVL